MSCDYSQLPHSGIRHLSPYIPGKSSQELASEKGLTDIIKLGSNENPMGCSPNVIQALYKLNHLDLATYPLAPHHPIRNALANQLGIDTDMLFFGNGSDSLFSLLLTCFALHTNKHILIHDYAFSAYAIQAKTLGIPVVSAAVNDDFSVNIDTLIRTCRQDTALIFLANPNNPTGLLVSKQNISKLLDNIPSSTIFVLDEAYYEYIQNHEPDASLNILIKHPNLVITRTFSKAYGLAGLRLGYAIANPQIISILHRVQLPFAINIAALTAGLAALEDTEFVHKSIELRNTGMKQMQDGIQKLGLTALPSQGNFITIDFKTDGMKIFNDLQNEGIIVRPLHPYGLNNFLRITIGTNYQNQRLLNTLKKIISNSQ